EPENPLHMPKPYLHLLALALQSLEGAPPCAKANFRRGRAKPAAERVVEVGQITKSGCKGDGADGHKPESRVGKHAVRVCKTLAKHELRKCDPLSLKDHMHVARGDTLA